MQKGTSWVTVLGGAFSFGDNGVILHIHAFNLILSQIVKKRFLSRNTKAGTTERSRFCRLYTFCHLPHTRCSRSPMTILQQMGELFNRGERFFERRKRE